MKQNHETIYETTSDRVRILYSPVDAKTNLNAIPAKRVENQKDMLEAWRIEWRELGPPADNWRHWAHVLYLPMARAIAERRARELEGRRRS